MKKALGRGLSALIPDSYVNKLPGPITSSEERNQQPQESAFQMISIDQICSNPAQPRHIFSPEGIEELAASIKERGILQPVIVKKTGPETYDLICGERRLRAALLCGLTQIPAVIKEIAQDEFLEWALIENIQREDLNPIEEAEAYQRLAERLLSQEEIAQKVGKNRTTIANTLRLLRLPKEVIELIQSGHLAAGHARAVLGLLTPEHQRQMVQRIIRDNLSVRQVEAMVNRSNAQKRRPKRARNLNPEVVDLEQRLSQHLGTQVKIFPRKDQKQGRIEMYYYSLDDLDRMLEKIALPKSSF